LYCFFQAEDGIRDFHVTGVQTCALPIFMIFGKIDAQKVLATELVYQYYKYSDLHMQSTDYLYLLEDNRTLYITGVFSERENSIKIGRASCREDGKILMTSVYARSLEDGG